MAMALLGAASSPAAIIVDHDMSIDANAFLGEAIWVVDGPTGPTTVEILPGADLAYLNVYGSSVVNIRGGRIQDDLAAIDHSQVNIYGGEIAAFEEDVWAVDASVINIYGGTFGDDLLAGDSGMINLYGGSFLKNGDGATLGVALDGRINVRLREYQVVPASPFNCCSSLVGVLEDGSSIDLYLFVDSANSLSAEISLQSVPEPCNFALATSALLILGFTLIPAKKRLPSPFAHPAVSSPDLRPGVSRPPS